ncbi:MAG TPA: response regulator [Rudaea sp.]|jgi:CheY-like chemotaxis protein
MYRFLLVDDEPQMLSVLGRVLAAIPVSELDGEQPDIEAFSSANLALRRADEVMFDLVIFDLQMPEVSGVDFLSRLLTRQPKIVRICLTGDPENPAVEGALQSFDDCPVLGKPWRNSELRSAIVNGLAGRAT